MDKLIKETIKSINANLNISNVDKYIKDMKTLLSLLDMSDVFINSKAKLWLGYDLAKRLYRFYLIEKYGNGKVSYIFRSYYYNCGRKQGNWGFLGTIKEGIIKGDIVTPRLDSPNVVSNIETTYIIHDNREYCLPYLKLEIDGVISDKTF